MCVNNKCSHCGGDYGVYYDDFKVCLCNKCLEMVDLGKL
jgi:ribosomal protein S14